jgi:FtsZ-binding cell division protein ZapB
MNAQQQKRSYVEIMRDELHEYSQRLVRENDQLRSVVTSLQRENERVKTESDEVQLQNRQLRIHAETFIREYADVMSALASAKRERDDATAELARMCRVFETMALQNGIYAELYTAVQKEMNGEADTSDDSTPSTESEPDEQTTFVPAEPGGELA